jgi:formylmethanofuran dehydrogenase subunit C
MSGWTLQPRAAAPLRLDMRGVLPAPLAALSARDVERVPVGHGRELLPLAEFFRVAPRDDGALVLAGDCSRCDRIGWGMDAGTLRVEGDAGDHAGSTQRGGTLTITGNAGDQPACEMAGGRLVVEGGVGDFAASTLPGSMDGMRGGSVIVRGSAGARCGDRMRRGTVIVGGDVGDFAGSRLVAGTLVFGGAVGAHAGHAMRRGTLVFTRPAAPAEPGYVPSIDDVGVFWQLLARELASFGAEWAGLAQRPVARWRGDVAVDGRGEWIAVR